MTEIKLDNDGYTVVEKTPHRFEKIGDSVEGLYVAKEIGKENGNGIYNLQDEAGKVQVVFGTTIIDSKMEIVPVGTYVRIEWIGEEPSNKGNPLRLFEVKYKPAPAKPKAV